MHTCISEMSLDVQFFIVIFSGKIGENHSLDSSEREEKDGGYIDSKRLSLYAN